MRIPEIDMRTSEKSAHDNQEDPEVKPQRPLRLPFSINIEQSSHQIIIKPSKILYFNRVAKTGSQSFIHLLKKQGEKLGFSFWPKIVQQESLVDTAEGLAEEIKS